MMSRSPEIADDVCPVDDQSLGELFRANDLFVPNFVSSLTPHTRALLALFCYRRSHLRSVGLAIAATCDENDLAWAGGFVGKALFAISTEDTRSVVAEQKRRKITLATGVLRIFKIDVESVVETAPA